VAASWMSVINCAVATVAARPRGLVTEALCMMCPGGKGMDGMGTLARRWASCLLVNSDWVGGKPDLGKGVGGVLLCLLKKRPRARVALENNKGLHFYTSKVETGYFLEVCTSVG